MLIFFKFSLSIKNFTVSINTKHCLLSFKNIGVCIYFKVLGFIFFLVKEGFQKMEEVDIVHLFLFFSFFNFKVLKKKS